MNYQMPFGKHKGSLIEDVPLSYLEWLLSQDWLKDPMKTEINTFLFNGNFDKLITKMEGIISDGLQSRGMTEGESRSFLLRLYDLRKNNDK